MNEVPPSLDLRPDHLDIVRDILFRHVPDRKVLAFGSRATWAAKEYSDLDLAVLGDEPLPLDVTSSLAESFEESDLPFKVDVVDWASTSESFRKVIKRDYVVLVRKDISTHSKRSPKYLDDVADFLSGGTPRKSVSDFWDGDIPWFSASNMDQRFLSNTKSKISQKGLDAGSKLAPKGATLLLVRGSGLFNYIPICFADRPVAFNQDVKAICAKPGTDPLYLHYWLESLRPKLRENIGVTGIGAGKFDLDFLKQLPFPDISKEQQKIIGRQASAFDRKIQLNRRMNETLEAMARALFKSWFVDFDPVRARMEGRETGLPRHIANLFPERLVESELGEIPEGWEIRPLDDIATFQNGLALQKYRPQGNEEWLPVVKIADLKNGKAAGREKATANIRPECIIDDGDIVFSWSGSLTVKVWCGGRAALNQHLFKVTSMKFPKWFFLHCLHSHLGDFQTIAAGKATTMGHIKRHHLSEAMCAVPDNQLMTTIDGFMSPLLEKNISVNIQSRTLTALRDALLPKLVSGELRVGRENVNSL